MLIVVIVAKAYCCAVYVKTIVIVATALFDSERRTIMRTSPWDYRVWNIEAMTGYKPITTFYEDFGIAEFYGVDAVVDTYERAMESWKDDYKYLTELVMALNWKIWEHYEDNEQLARTYDALWSKCADYAMSHLKDDELSYYFRVTD